MKEALNLGQKVGVQLIRKESVSERVSPQEVVPLISEVVVDVGYDQTLGRSIPNEVGFCRIDRKSSEP